MSKDQSGCSSDTAHSWGDMLPLSCATRDQKSRRDVWSFVDVMRYLRYSYDMPSIVVARAGSKSDMAMVGES